MEYTLTKKERFSETVWGFWFDHSAPPSWSAGQYMEWVLPHENADSRGKRRFFTVCSSPTERELMIVTKIIDQSSSYKLALKNMEVGAPITARGLEGDFVLQKDGREKLLFIAGGIGITPFRAMIKYLLDNGQKRDIVLLYANKTNSDAAFVDLLKEAGKIGVKTIYFFSDSEKPILPAVTGLIGEPAIKRYVPDWRERTFYISGPEPMVEAYEKMVVAMGVAKKGIKTDFFPGYDED